MANNCFYDIKVRGNKEGVNRLVNLFEASNTAEKTPCIGRVYSAYVYDRQENETEAYVCISGDCAWSVLAAIIGFTKENALEQCLREYKLDAECYSEEPGVGFMEHFLWKDGVRIEETCTDFTEVNVEDLEEDLDDSDWFFEDEHVKILGITKENYKNFANDDGYIRIGGFIYHWHIEEIL